MWRQFSLSFFKARLIAVSDDGKQGSIVFTIDSSKIHKALFQNYDHQILIVENIYIEKIFILVMR